MNPSTDDSARNFLAEIFEPEGEPLESGCIAIWNKATHHTRLAQDPDEAARIASTGEFVNVAYFGVCTRDRVALRKRASDTGKPLHAMQGEYAECSAMPGIWVDIDIRASGHKKESLAPSIEAALSALADAVPIKPTLTVETGGGIHAYWLFDEGVVPFGPAGSTGSREDMETLVRSYQAMVRDELQKRGWSDDQTWPLPRVMRLPGGYNVSHGEPRAVTWERTSRRYTIAELREVIPAGILFSEPQKVEHSDDRAQFMMTPVTAELTSTVNAFVADVCDIDEEFAAVWNRKRRSLPSQSEMDLSIATRLAAGDTPSQMIVDALRVHRLAADPGSKKADRTDYYLGVLQLALGATDEDRRRKRTIERSATAEAEMKRARTMVVSKDAATREAGAVIIHDVERGKDSLVRDALSVVNEAFKLKDTNRICKIVRQRAASGATEDWRFVFENKSVRTVKGGQLMNCFQVRTEVFLATGIQVQQFTLKPNKPRQWGPVALAIHISAVDLGDGDEASKVIGSLVRYIEGTLLTGVTMSPAPFSEPWHRAVERGERALLWSAPDGSGGVLLRLDAWVESLAYDPLGPSGPAGSVRGWATYLTHSVGEIERPSNVSFVRENGVRGTRRGYIRIRRAFLESHGGADVAELLDAAIATAPEE